MMLTVLNSSRTLVSTKLHALPLCLRTCGKQRGNSIDFLDPVGVRGIYTHIRDTGIAGFEKNKKLIKNKLPSYMESCPDILQEEVEAMYRAFPAVVQDLVDLPYAQVLKAGNERTRECLEYICPWNPLTAVQVMMADRFYARQRKLKNQVKSDKDEKERLDLAHKCAWCAEIVGRANYLSDDIIDHGQERNGLLCWNNLPHIGLSAVNDIIMVSTGGYILLKKYFEDKEYYSQLVDALHKYLYLVALGESDLSGIKVSSKEEALDTNLLSRFREAKIALNANLIPNATIAVAMIINGITDPELFRLVEKMGCDVMNYSLIIDDYQDCYGGVHVSQRVGNDIQEGKQTHLLFKALELGSQEQCERLLANYGKKDPACVQTVRDIYSELNIREIMIEIAEELYKEYRANIANLPQDELPCSIWINLMAHFHGVSKGLLARA